MANKKISELPTASAPDGSELMEVVQGGVNKKLALDDLPDGGGAVDSVNGQTGTVVLDAGDIANTPAGGISATTVQAAIDELDTDKQNVANTASALTDGSAITITGPKHTLTTDEATITFSQSFAGDFTNIDVTFNTTAATWTFPAGSLCVVEGAASGNNTATIAAVSGDKIVISIWFVAASTYRVAVKNFGQ